jgi:hypothetical protein
MSESLNPISKPWYFQPGNKVGLKAKAVRKEWRRALTSDLLEALSEDFKAHGIEAVRQVRVEEPANYLRIIASLVPKEIEVAPAPTEGMAPDELAAAIGILRELLASAAELDPEDTIVGIRAPDGEAETGHILPSDGASEAGTVSEAHDLLRGGGGTPGTPVPGRKPRRKDGGGGGV